MKNWNRIAAAVVVLTMACPFAAQARTVAVPWGTEVVAKFIDDVEPSKIQVGDNLLLAVDKDVVVDGQVVIKQGARIRAEVADSKKKGYAGQSGRVRITFRSVAAVDGQEISLSGSKSKQGEDSMVQTIVLGTICCPLFLFSKGEEGIIKSGQTVSAFTADDRKIEVAQ